MLKLLSPERVAIAATELDQHAETSVEAIAQTANEAADSNAAEALLPVEEEGSTPVPDTCDRLCHAELFRKGLSFL